ncbi:MAG: hypothetical protein KZQ73_07975 [Candidatus Thiodiazotropha sp. (ex Semelilucina semeliformis)]|nr:hypothetical protein [Candidatus Thiodiazotropha sp. (ex Semelilucina semeliformis)]
MNHLYYEYEENLRQLRELEQDDLARSLRLFNIRIRLAIDIQIDFKGEISLTKTKEVRDTYVLLIQLMELWNAYEALSHYVAEVTDHLVKKVSKSKIYTQTYLKQVGSLSSLAKTIASIREMYKKSTTFREDFDNYIERIKEDEKLSKTLKDDATSIGRHAKEGIDISGIEVLSLIYAERNMYYHNGETAKMRMRYSNRKKLISWYKEVLFEQTLKVANSVIIEQIEANK